MQYSPGTAGFYDPAIHGTAIPADAVDLSDDLYHALLDAQA